MHAIVGLSPLQLREQWKHQAGRHTVHNFDATTIFLTARRHHQAASAPGAPSRLLWRAVSRFFTDDLLHPHAAADNPRCIASITCTHRRHQATTAPGPYV